MNEVTVRFVERIALLCEEDGLPRIAGRLIGLLLLEGGAFSLDELAERLQVSKASVSTNARILERIGVIERISEPGDRRDYYRINDCPWEHMFEVVQRRMRSTHEILAEGRASLPPSMESARRRLRAWEEFYAFMLENLETNVAAWRERCAATHEPTDRSVGAVR